MSNAAIILMLFMVQLCCAAIAYYLTLATPLAYKITYIEKEEK